MVRAFKTIAARSLPPLVVLGGLWYLLLQHLAVHWTLNPQYNFGWFGPLLAAYLFLERWKTRPDPQAGRSKIVSWLFCLSGIALLPTWLVAQPNPDWRLVSWALAFEVVLLTLCFVYFAGGKAWFSHFALSICLILAAVPWPAGVEGYITQTLTGTATWLTVCVLNLFSIQALNHGNLIEIKNGVLGIDEACSGIRSLPVGVLVSLFLGEVYQLRWLRRIMLIILGAAIAFVCNIGRTFFLVFIATEKGLKAVHAYHDPAGYIFMAVCILVLWTLARLLGRRLNHDCPSPRTFRQLNSGRLLQKKAIYLGGWLLMILLGTELWYNSHESAETIHWSFRWPERNKHFSALVLSQHAVDELRYDEGRAASWENVDGSAWTAMFFKWNGEPTHARILARLHRPDDCLPGLGYKFKGDKGAITVTAQNLLIPFHALEFVDRGEPAYVFYCLWQDRPKMTEKNGYSDSWNRRLVELEISDRSNLFARIESVFLGQRNLAQQTLEIVIFGYRTYERAEAALRGQLNQLIRSS